MKKLTITSSLLLAIGMLFGVAQAQLRIDPNAGKMNPAIKKQAAINKILDAKIVKAEFTILKENGWSDKIFKSRTIAFTENNKGNFALIADLSLQPKFLPKPNVFPYVTPPTAAMPQSGLHTSTYRDLLKNGFTAKIEFGNREDIGIRFPLGKEWSADFFCTFYFSDGTVVGVPFQDINVNKHGTFKTTTVLTVSKVFPGSVFPDPENPLVLPVVK